MALRRRKRDEPRQGTPADLLVVGLGNPGAEYEGTRHNVGAEVVAVLADRYNERLKPSREAALSAELRIGTMRMVVAFPQTWMNRSGESVRSLVRRHGIEDLARLVIVHDELDIEPGRMKVKSGGGLAGHNGLRSTRDHLKTAEFTRVRIGVGRPPDRLGTADWVLKRFGRLDRVIVDRTVRDAADACEAMLHDTLDSVMNTYNRQDTRGTS